ncbi:hypothetical protein M441DRAFT_249439 [Trichoderma asperellum CBS 433.97]|uniref:Uncharacterized protein n=1 Tax=Trichoderma asperellum (strain ATCC 204424 / CBS 433.97 / NBRC 101777) TaxID=1042311 RepID=A0A2T3Z0D2_TRIA4|nr:hypothetical protein M441DRAFT_249439 [Trichoderma asperellum CBS 433.97]PTB38263.1 hypothetical protein M441DRAFT_249439 [Trichoderma asperellum CBS 433.97]
MDELDGTSQARGEDDDASLLRPLQRYDDDDYDYDWWSDPEGRLIEGANDQHSIHLPSSPEYETEPGLSPDSNLQEGHFPTPMSIDQYPGIPITPSQDAFESSNAMLTHGAPNPLM